MPVKKPENIVLKLNTRIYPQEVIIETCYRFLDRAYLYLDMERDKVISVYFKTKDIRKNKELHRIKDEFLNDLIYANVRHIVHRNNNKITEYIVKKALYSVMVSESEKERLLDKYLDKEGIDAQLPQEDPLGIAVPWEEKHAKEELQQAAVENKPGGGNAEEECKKG